MSIRLFIILAAPIVVVWAFVDTLIREITHAFGFAYLQARSEVGQLAAAWRARSINPQDWKQ